MGRRGPVPKSSRKRKARGNPGKRRPSRRKSSKVAGGCPDWLDEAARAKWAEVVPQLGRLGLLPAIAADALAAYCQAWAEFRLATETLRKEGRVVETDSGYKAPHPAVSQQRSAWKAMADFRRLLGDAEAPSEERDEFEDFIKGAG